MARERLRAKAKDLPDEPGVYLFRGAEGQVLYVGKASSLRKRVASYLGSSRTLPLKVRPLVRQAHDVEAIATRSQAEALILEDALIKKHRPPHNVRLRDDKRYPYLKLTAEPFPRLVVVRRPEDDGAHYFGPYTSSQAMRRTLRLVHKLFPLRTCTLEIGVDRIDRPCLMFDLGRCPAPCVGKVDSEVYRQPLEDVRLFLRGRMDEVIARLQASMEAHATGERYEQAAHVRDQIAALERIHERQAVALPEALDLDAVAVALEEARAYGTVLVVRGGRLIGREGFHLATPPGASSAEVLAEFLDQFYTRTTAIPHEVLVPEEVPEGEMLASYLTRRAGARVRVRVARRGERAELMAIAERNARLSLKRAALAHTSHHEPSLEELSKALNLTSHPWRIEAYDVSNLHGQEATGSMVVFVGGQPRPDAYRRFRVRASGQPDDTAMMREVLNRRFRRGLAELRDTSMARGKFSDMPDLVLVDGGLPQLGAAVQALGTFPELDTEVAALAKREELVYRPHRRTPIRLPRRSPALGLLQRIRDEAHRFAVDYHRLLRGRRALASLLDGIVGIGPRRKELLLKRFGSLEGLRAASLEELLSVRGIPRDLAERLYKALHAE